MIESVSFYHGKRRKIITYLINYSSNDTRLIRITTPHLSRRSSSILPILDSVFFIFENNDLNKICNISNKFKISGTGIFESSKWWARWARAFAMGQPEYQLLDATGQKKEREERTEGRLYNFMICSKCVTVRLLTTRSIVYSCYARI